ncbi:hypothetical protein FisN_5Lh291 [Fistulifera solaris]|uniref:R3H domain-containing protein n=1 Tax=Fistulifera solaris TaxID=1519565 RepID=A0A1Z5KG28_FISSO|nr:hypothetical protein FisN_5Lh291 [Fistulifera solaris]|eukprot:GAX25209.1 hypothetical protein FisN_5Lh291 [Fistulifera solaris]
MPETVTVSVHGVQLKRFEQVVAKLLTHITPRYSQLPSPPHPFREWKGTGKQGQIEDPVRAQRKQDQIKSLMRCILSLLPEQVVSSETSTKKVEESYTIVDFGGGSGHLSIPLALTLPQCRIICVDLSAPALTLLHEKVKEFCTATAVSFRGAASTATNNSKNLQATCIPNLFTFHGPVQAFDSHLDMAVALHLCGEATDVALRVAAERKASAMVISPCCVGKLAGDGGNPYVFQASGQNHSTISYPQSNTFCQLILGTAASVNKYNRKVKTSEHSNPAELTNHVGSDRSDWDALAKSADYSSMPETRTPRNAARRTAKALLETDRSLFLQEAFQYETCLTRMDPWEASPKNDIILAWRQVSQYPSYHPVNMPPDVLCERDILQTMNHLLNTHNEKDRVHCDTVDWTKEEEDEIRQKIIEFLESQSGNSGVLLFPTRMGGRKRKLIHFVAEQMQLAHWSHGRKEAEKTVAVSRVRQEI